ncbi:MAG: membrane protein of unknown function [Promethearchaeota archaeon]|nr:MAG: membrane protein of unknown function [Candidatus Lokiarchaeota archaeon]
MKRSIIFSSILFLFYFFALFNSIFGAFTQGSKATSIVPISNLELQTHLLLFNSILPNILAPLFVIIFPLVFVPLFLYLKDKIWYKYENTYIDIPIDGIDMKKFAKRAVYLFLLTMGLSATILNTNLITAEQFLSLEQENYWVLQQGIEEVLYITDIFYTISNIVFAFALGLLAIGWTLEDCGLMHYYLPEKEEKELYEIEPIYRKYQSIIKGYAGISAIIYYISAIAYYVINRPNDLSNLFGMIGLSIPIVFTMVPSYFLYLKFIQGYFKKRLTKGKEELRIIGEEEIKL